MSFWSSQRIEAEQQKQPLIEPFEPKHIQQGAYELALSREVLTTPDGSTDVTTLGTGPALVIPPGQFALLYTEERVTIPANVLSFISIKAKVKLKGLVNVSGFHVDPGFSGRLKFSVYNAGNKPIHLGYGEPCFLLWFSDLDTATKDPYCGGHNGQTGITTDDRDQMSEGSHSPAALHQRLEKVERHLNLFMTITGAIMAAIILPLFVGVAVVLMQRWLEGQKGSEAQKPAVQSPANTSLPATNITRNFGMTNASPSFGTTNAAPQPGRTNTGPSP